MSSAWGKRMSSAWGKRMSSAWGKRAESESDELYNNIIRELYLQARRNKNDHSRFSIGNAGNERRATGNERTSFLANPFGLDQFLAQRSVATNNNNDDEAVDQDAS